MKRLIGAILLVTFLNGCSGIPLVSTLEGSLSINGVVAGATGKYEAQGLSAVVNLASHRSTGKTISQHLYAAVENKYTKNQLEKHFKNKKLSLTEFEIAKKSLNDFGGFLPKDMGKWRFGKKKVIEQEWPNNITINHDAPAMTKIDKSTIRYVKLTNYTVLDKYAPSYKHPVKKNTSVDFTLQCNFSHFCKKTNTKDISF